jgi:RapA N-terminal Tudor like domain 1
MLNIKPGQRWISAAEPELGLGTILRADNRQIDIIFTGCGELKHFTHAASPLLRVAFQRGDRIAIDRKLLQVEEVGDSEGVLVYQCGNQRLIEGAIDPDQPMLPLALRLLIGQCDAGHLFDLRRMGLQLHELSQADFEYFAMALLDHHGYRLSPVSEHAFRVDQDPGRSPDPFVVDSVCTFDAEADGMTSMVRIDRDHPLISGTTELFLQSHVGNAGFLVDDSLASRSAVLETLFVNGATTRHLAIDALGNVLSDYRPNEQALFRSRGSQNDLKPYQRSLERLYPVLLDKALERAENSDAGTLQALRLVVGSEFALFGRQVR